MKTALRCPEGDGKQFSTELSQTWRERRRNNNKKKKKNEWRREKKKAHVWAATYSCCMVSIVAFERAEREVAEQSQSVRGSNFFLLFRGEKLFCAVTQKTP